jgi:hypothetical protein
MHSDRPRKVDMRLISSVKIETFNNIRFNGFTSFTHAKVVGGIVTSPLILNFNVCALEVMRDNINMDAY